MTGVRRFTLVVIAASLIASCQGAAGAGLYWVLLAGLALAGWWGCGAGDEGRGDAGSCCVNGRMEICYCPPRATCNFTRCSDAGSDSSVPADAAVDAADAPADAPTDAPADAPADVPPEVVRDAGPDGIWFQCCEHGQLTTCYCPPMWACNYFGHVICGDGTCIARNVGLPDAAYQCPADAGAH